MSVSNTTLRSPASGGYACDGSTTAFAGTFNLLAEGDVDVILTDVNGSESTLTLTTDYTVSPTGGSYPCTAFTVTTVSTYATGNTITLIRSMALTQPTAYGNAGPYYPNIHETSYDRLLLQLQQQQEILDRCVKDAASATATTDPDSYLAACQAAQAAAEAAEAGSTNANTNLYRVDVASTANIDLTTDLENGDTVDGVTLSTGMRVLCKDQSVGGQDGIYVVPASGAASRADDYPVGTAPNGHVYSVDQGTANGNKLLRSNYVAFATIGTSGLDVEEILDAENLAANEHWVKRGSTMTAETVSVYAGTLLDDANAAAARSTLGLDSMATQAASAVAITGGTIKGAGAKSTDDVLWIRDEKSSGTAGGTFSSGSWTPRDLNTVKRNNITGAAMLYELPYDNKTGTFQDGETVTGGTSAATGVIYSRNGGSSPLYVYTITGTFQDNEQITGGTSAATADVDNLSPEDAGTGLNYANRIILPAGDYWIDASAPAYEAGNHKLQLYNIDDAAAEIIGDNNATADATTVQTKALLTGFFTLDDVHALELQHRCSVGEVAVGFGGNNSFSVVEVYAEMTIYKV